MCLFGLLVNLLFNVQLSVVGTRFTLCSSLQQENQYGITVDTASYLVTKFCYYGFIAAVIILISCSNVPLSVLSVYVLVLLPIVATVKQHLTWG